MTSSSPTWCGATRRVTFAKEFLVVGDDAFDLRNLAGDRQQRQDEIVAEQDLRAAVVEDGRQFRALQANVEHDQHCADQWDGEVSFQCQHTVAGQHGDPIAGSNTRVLKGRCEGVHALLEFRISESPVAVHYGGAGTIDGGAPRQEIQRREDRFHDLHLSLGVGADYISRWSLRSAKYASLRSTFNIR